MNDSILPLNKRIFILILIILPILNQYQLFGIKMIEIISGIVLLWMLVKKNLKIIINGYVRFALYGFLGSILSTSVIMLWYPNDISIGTIFLRWVKYIVVFIAISYVGQTVFNTKFAVDVYTKSAFLCSVIVIIQFIVNLVFNTQLYLIIPNTVLNYNSNMTAQAFLEMMHSRLNMGFPYRPSSLFIEPAHFAIYVLPAFAILLLNRNKDGFALPGLITIALFMSSSSLGIVGCLVIWCCFLVNSIRRGTISRKWIVFFPIVLIVGLLIFPNIISSDAVQFTLRTKKQSLMHLSSSSSLTLRLIRGIYYYISIGVGYKLIGVGYGNLDSYYRLSGLNLSIDTINTEYAYMNGLEEVLCMFGIVGFIIFIMWLIKSSYKDSMCKAICLAMFVIMLGSEFYDTATFYLCVLFILSTQADDKSKYIGKDTGTV